jgi:hypothetical protein
LLALAAACYAGAVVVAGQGLFGAQLGTAISATAAVLR